MKRIEKIAILYMFKGLVCAPLSSSAPVAEKNIFISVPSGMEEGSVARIYVFSFSPILDTFKIILPFGDRDTFNFFPKDSFNQSRIIPMPAKTDTNFFVFKIFSKTDTIYRGISVLKKEWPKEYWLPKKIKATEVKQPIDSITIWVNSFSPDTKDFHGEIFDPMDRELVVTSLFGVRQVGKYKTKFHYGIDYLAEKYTRVYAVADGFIGLTRNSARWGKTVLLCHGGDIQTVYLHLSKFTVEEGDFVHACELISYSGNTGGSTGPHLHFTMRVCEIPVDPIAFKKFLELESISSKLQ